MELRNIRIYSAVATLLVFCIAVTVEGGTPSEQSESTVEKDCVLAVGDLNGDGILDYAVTNRPVNGSPVVSLIFGRSESLPATDGAPYPGQKAAVVLRGPFAAPFTCPDDSIPVVARRTPGVGTDVPDVRRGKAKRRRPLSDNPINQPISYTMVDLDPLMPGYSSGFSSRTSGINAGGQVVGQFFTQSSDRAFVYDKGELRDLGTLGGLISEARDVNDAGTIVGFSLTGETDASGFVNAAFASDGYSMRHLGIRWSSAEAINNAGQIVGQMEVQPNLNHAFLYEQGSITALGTLPPFNDTASSGALSINGIGQIVGESATFVTGILNPTSRHSAVHAFLSENGIMRDLGTLGVRCTLLLGNERCTDRSTATGINNYGQVVGFSTTPSDGSTHAFATMAGRPQDLGTLGGSGSWAYGVNDSGQIVGGSLNAQEQFVPFLYDQGTMYDLNTLILNPSGTLPFIAYAVNNFGQIAGNHHLLNPVYETVAPGRRLSFNATLGETFTFEYWVARGDSTACAADRNRLRLKVKIDTAAGEGNWLPVAVQVGCDNSIDWSSATLTIPDELRNTPARIHLRVRESSPWTHPLVHLRHFRMQ